MSYVKALISATSSKEARKIVGILVKQKLIAGALIMSGESLYWWKKRMVRRTYWNITAFSKKSLTKEIIREVEKVHSDEIPIISFQPIIDANEDFLNWISESTVNKSSKI